VVTDGIDLIALASIGVGGSTAAAAISAALFGGSGADWVGAGSGVDATDVLPVFSASGGVRIGQDY